MNSAVKLKTISINKNILKRYELAFLIILIKQKTKTKIQNKEQTERGTDGQKKQNKTFNDVFE